MAVFSVNGVDIFYEVHGDPNGKNTVAFLNGVMASTSSWYLLEPVFRKAGFRIILHDFKGQLKSSKPAGPYTFAQHCEEFKALLDHLGVEKTHLIGTSYGGEVAMKMAILYPETVQSISLIDSVSELDPVCKGFVTGWKVLCDTHDGETFFWGMAPSIYGSQFLANNQEMLAQRAKAIKNDPDGYLEGQKTLYDTFAEDVYMTDIVTYGVIFNLYYAGVAATEMPEGRAEPAVQVDETTPEFKQVHFSGIVCAGAGQAIYINGLPELPVSAVSFKDCNFTAGKGAEVNYAEDITFDNVSVNGETL